jgi:hypothetical protein
MEKQRFRLLGLPTSDTPSVMNLESRTSSAEALRIVRTNLEFMLSKVPEGWLKLFS